MQNKPYDLVVFIGRFQIVHNAHKAIIDRACELANHKVVVIVGSADKPRTFKNPFSTKERKAMLGEITKNSPVPVFLEHVYDHTYNDTAWAAQIQRIVSDQASRPWTDKGMKIAIIGHKKDESSFYLDMFPQWDFIDQDLIEPLDATQIRDLYFNRKMNMNYIRGVVPETTAKFLEDFRTSNSEAYEQIIREKEFIANYKKQYEHLKYAPTFVTADAVVIQSGHVLMIKRKAEPGKGLWALPGGYLDADTDRSLVDAMIRELREETGLKIPEKVLRGSITRNHVFDAIGRSERGRIITQAFKIELEGNVLPKVTGMNDVDKAIAKAKWIPLSEVKREECFEDHYCILQDMVGV
jgi:bifunctional NMN adenylyltransferase/nudix hydrolase